MNAATPRRERPDADANNRPDVRPTMRDEDDSLARAALRAAEVRQHVGSMDEGTDDFYVDPAIIPRGWSYEWKTHTVVGQQDPAYQVHLARMGWTPVPLKRHPAYMPEGWTGATIERKGQILMERPLELTMEARDIELKRARNQLRQKVQQLNETPNGQLPRDEDARTRAKVSTSYEAVPIPHEM